MNFPSPPVPLFGLVLAGGRSSRLGRDKGAVDYHGESQAAWALAQLRRYCDQVYVSIRSDQAADPTYAQLPVIRDSAALEGPASGLLAAHERFPEVAWLVLAIDMPLVDAKTLGTLVAARDAARLATAYLGSDGLPEPLCAIWEPEGGRAVRAAAATGRPVSLRGLLREGPVELLHPPVTGALRSANTPDEAAWARAQLRLRAAERGRSPAVPDPGES